MSQLVDRIYECAFVPDLWRTLLADLANVGGARVGWLCVSNGPTLNCVASTDQGQRLLQPLIDSGWILRSERLRRLLHATKTGFVTESDVYAPDEIANDLAYRNVLYPAGLGWASATAISLPTGDTLVMAMERNYAEGPPSADVIQALNDLHPHLARASLVAARLHLERARAASQTLALIGVPAVALDESGKVLSANELITSLPGYIHWRADDRIALTDTKADTLFQTTLATLRRELSPQVQSFPVRGGRSLMIGHLVPIRRAARDIFARCAAMLMLTPVARPSAPPIEVVRSLFDLTPAEASVASGIAAGQTVENLAAERGTSINTIRAHVRGVLVKTGRNRQADVVALLNRLWVPPRAD
jgi:DNA-binding CsgD family transcriptional regulator